MTIISDHVLNNFESLILWISKSTYCISTYKHTCMQCQNQAQHLFAINVDTCWLQLFWAWPIHSCKLPSHCTELAPEIA